MSGSQPSKVFMFDQRDPAMQLASEQARSTFRYFWREMSWEGRRIIPALDLACVKAPFSDSESNRGMPDQPEVEYIWLGGIDFDGQYVSGDLLNAPNWLKDFKQGDSARFQLGEITDWMYAISGEVYGAYSVNLMRSRMSTRERKDHDNAWGLDFGDPRKVRVVPQKKGWFGKGSAQTQEHPMSESMATTLRQELAKNPSMLHWQDEKGRTLLHHDALAGSAPTVEILLECGANPNVMTANGGTPLQFAKVLGWDKVIALLVNSGATK